MNHRIKAALLLVAGVFASQANLALSQTYPSKPVLVIAPFSPGTAVDLVGRVVADGLSKDLQTPVVLENRLGASGQIGTAAVAKAPADGYTLLFTSAAHYINKSLYSRLSYDPDKDFKPIGRMSSTALVLVVPKSSPVNSVQELIAYARARPGQLNYSSAGSGSTTQLPAALFNSMAGIQVTHVPYKSGGQALTDVIGGQVFMTFTAVASALPHVKAGTLKALAVTGPHRTFSMPDVPTIAQSGLTGYEFLSWNAMFAPAGTPDAVVARIEASLKKIAESPDFQQRMRDAGLELDSSFGPAFAASLQKEAPMLAKLVELSGAKID